MADQPTDPAEQTATQGTVVAASDPDRLRLALEAAFDYRGDVTIRRTSGELIAGYIFDRVVGETLEESRLRIDPADGSGRVTVRYDEVAEISFTGRDTAQGKSFDTWMRKFVEKKLAGEKASIEAEPLEE